MTKMDKIERVSMRVSGGIPGCIERQSNRVIGGQMCAYSRELCQ